MAVELGRIGVTETNLGKQAKLPRVRPKTDNKPEGPITKDGNPLIQYHKCEGIWYEVTFEGTFEVDWRMRSSVIDPLSGNYITDWEYKRKYGGLYNYISKRQINSKEIKRLGLRG